MITTTMMFAGVVAIIVLRVFVYFYNAYIAGCAIQLQQQFDAEDHAIAKLNTPAAIRLAYISARGPDWDGYDFEAALDKLSAAKGLPAGGS